MQADDHGKAPNKLRDHAKLKATLSANVDKEGTKANSDKILRLNFSQQFRVRLSGRLSEVRCEAD